MANGLDQRQTDEVSRRAIATLIKKYSASEGRDKQTLSLLLEQLAKTPLYFAVEKGSDLRSGANVRFVTLTVGGQTFIPAFTEPSELGRLEGRCECVLLAPMDYFQMLVDKGRHAVINPFGSYFLMWPELMRDHMLPYMKESEKVQREQGGSGEPFTIM